LPKLKLKEAIENLKPYIGRPFGDFLTEEQLENIRINKGLTGQLLEILLGLDNTTSNIDFVDGELKTNRVKIDGTPKETMYIKQLSSMVDDVIREVDFYKTDLYKKMRNLLYVPVYKGGRDNKLHRSKWKLFPYIHINLENEDNYDVLCQLERDYYTISEKMKKDLNKSEESFIHTSNGEFIQIRTKDSKPYTPIYSEIYDRAISNKNYAFYFRREFMMFLQERSDKYPLY